MTIQIYNNCYGFLTSIYEFVFYYIITNIIKITNVNSMIVIEVKYVAIILPSTLPFISPLTCSPSTLSCSHPLALLSIMSNYLPLLACPFMGSLLNTELQPSSVYCSLTCPRELLSHCLWLRKTLTV